MKFLHVGCGHKNKSQTTQGFLEGSWEEVRFDIDESVNPDVLGTMTDMSAIESKSIDAIYSSHNIEHLYPHEVGVALTEFNRVLVEDGFVIVTCPDLQSVCELIANNKLLEPAYNSPAGPIAPLDILYGHRPAMAAGNLYMAHKCGFTQRVLMDTFKGFGFESVVGARRAAPYFDLFCAASKSKLSQAELEQLARSHFP